MQNFALGIDVGATKIAVGLISPTGEIKSRTEIPSQTKDSDLLNANLKLAIESQLEQPGVAVKAVGIGSAGPIDIEHGTIKPVNIKHWQDFSLTDFVSKVSGIDNVVLVGDASAMTFAETKIGAAKNSLNVLGIVVSTGIGGGLVIDGRHHIGYTGNASFIGHNVVQMDGPLCACGSHGCVEVYSSGPSMAKWASSNGLQMKNDSSFHELADQARAANPIARAAIERGTEALAVSLANAVAMIDLELIVVGGGVMNAADIYWDSLESKFNTHQSRLGFSRNCQLIKAELGGDSGLVGAGLIALSN